MRLSRRFLLASAILCGAAPAWSPPAWSQCQSTLPAASLVRPGTLQLAITPTQPPQQFVDEKGELQGLNVELGRELGKRLCLPVEFVRMDFPAMVPALRGGRFDALEPCRNNPLMLAHALSRKEERGGLRSTPRSGCRVGRPVRRHAEDRQGRR